MEKNPIQGENLANFGDFLGILVQKHLRGEVKKFFLLRLSTRLVHEKLNFGIFEFYDFAEKNWKKIRFKFWNFGRFFFFADFAENLLRWSSEKINFELFGTLELLVGKLEKNPIPSLKFGKF